MRRLHRSSPHPYYIFAPDYRRSSAGVRTLYLLCDALRQSGQSAYVTGRGAPESLDAPRLTEATVRGHRDAGLEPIVIYPEIVSGNPLQARTVVRYWLNAPAFFTGNYQDDPTDIRIAYSKDLLVDGMSEDDVLFLPFHDLGLFSPPPDESVRVPGKTAYYRHWPEGAAPPVDPGRIPAGAVEINATYPEAIEDLVRLFHECEFFYAYKSTALLSEAALCGCTAVCIPNPDAPVAIAGSEMELLGVAWGDTPQALEWARTTRLALRERMERWHRDFWPALDGFVERTQTAAAERLRREGVHRRLELPGGGQRKLGFQYSWRIRRYVLSLQLRHVGAD